jgi:limonene-1,2-epoxide hydrolase
VTLYGDFFKDNHHRIHKWYQYFALYEQHSARFRNRHVTIFEIGVGEGGSLQQWRDYFGPFAIIVGIDIYPRSLLSGVMRTIGVEVPIL